MVLRQYYLGCLAQASYLIADERSGRAVVVDPRRDVDVYLEDLRSFRLVLESVFLTHFHADFVAGHLELSERTGCRIRLGARAEAAFPFVPVSEGDIVDLGSVRLEILETPGHTPEAISIVVYDASRRAARPYAALTGDALFVGDVGRPDLAASGSASPDALGRALYRSVRQKLLALPDETLVYPGHGAGSMCGKNLGPETFSTIGEQRRSNRALQPMSEEAFVQLVTTDLPPAPAYFPYAAALNRSNRKTLPAVLARSAVPLDLARVLQRRDAGADVLDVREPPAFAAGHLAGSVNIGLSGKFATWAGTLLPRDHPIVVVADPGREAEAITRLARIGYDAVEGYLVGGAAALGHRPDLVAVLPRLTPAELVARMASASPPVIVDVRTVTERQGGHIDPSVHIPLQEFPQHARELPAGRDLVAVCASGYRSCTAASLLARAGRAGVADLLGGMAAWSDADIAALQSLDRLGPS
jgi:glyoxylase-like metal-dependent hydrolase (beta-lactamase superfamily II)/rhodanese-related sulfurtransferase